MIEKKTDEDSPRSVNKPPCVSPNKRSNNTLLNSRRTDNSLKISTLVTPVIYHDADDSRVQIYSSDPGKKNKYEK